MLSVADRGAPCLPTLTLLKEMFHPSRLLISSLLDLNSSHSLQTMSSGVCARSVESRCGFESLAPSCPSFLPSSLRSLALNGGKDSPCFLDEGENVVCVGGLFQRSPTEMVVICARLEINELQTSLSSISTGRPLTSAAPQTPHSSPRGRGWGAGGAL